jgi:aryl-alcohol dehydrogenase-like predicted oxidoreductase
MEYVNLGKAGVKVSRICLGAMTFGSREWRDDRGLTRDWVLEEDEAQPIFRRAVELGINFFDTADVYSRGISEEITGRAMREFFGNRDEYVLATKVCQSMGEKPNQSGLSRKHILHGIDASLRRLGLDHVDLYQIHRWDPSTPIEETMEVLHDVVRAGKARYIGASSMYAWQFAKALFTADLHGWTRFVSMQNHYNVIYREEEREMIPLCMDQGIAITPWSPLARGFVMGNRSQDKSGETARAKSDAFAHSMYYQDVDFLIADRVGEVGKRVGASRAQVALAWILQKPGTTSPIVGTTKLEHLENVVKALDVKLTAEDVARLEEPYRPKCVLGM